MSPAWSVPVDLRSDTFTTPDAEMRRVMAQAEVGDDVWGEDPTVRRLEEEMAAMLGKAAAVFVPSGTMGNLASLAAQTRPGDEVIVPSMTFISSAGRRQPRKSSSIRSTPSKQWVASAIVRENC